MSQTKIPPVFLILATFAFGIVSCKKPVKREANSARSEKEPLVEIAEAPEQPPTPTAPPPPPPRQEVTTAPQTQPQKTTSPPAKPKKVALPKARPPVFRPAPKVTSRSVQILPDGSKLPTLIIIEDESPLDLDPPKSPTLLIKGEMASESQFRDAVKALGKALPGHAITSEVTFPRHTKNVDWQNRVSTLWGTCFHQVTNGEWEYKDGFVILKGTTDSQFTANGIGRLAKTIMTGNDVNGIQNLLTVP